MLTTGQKVCRKCGSEKPLDDFAFTTTPSRDGAKSWTYPRPEGRESKSQLPAARFQRNKERYRSARGCYYTGNLDRYDFWRSRTRARRLGATQFMSFEEW